MQNKKNRRGPRPYASPVKPEKVLEIFQLKREHMLHKDIAERIGVTPAAITHHVQRWAEWAAKQLTAAE